MAKLQTFIDMTKLTLFLFFPTFIIFLSIFIISNSILNLSKLHYIFLISHIHHHHNLQHIAYYFL